MFSDQSTILPEGFTYIQDFISQERACDLFKKLHKDVAWSHETITMFGKEITIRRMSALYGDQGTRYRYAGTSYKSLPWLPHLRTMKSFVSDHTHTTFNICLLNNYHDGTEQMGWHSDNEPELGKEPTIACLSLGASRRFDIKDTATGEKRSIDLEPGSLLIMSGDSQSQYKHQIPKQLRIKESRISLTFRNVAT